jgi:uncharacterized hydrophobic protein (TIGR00271 family)
VAANGRSVAKRGGFTRRLTGESRTPEEIRDAVYLFGGDVGVKQSRFWLLLVLAGCIATAGIVSDSTATVIGAMIVAPLAVPIQGTAVGIAYGELRPLLLSVAIVVCAMAVVIAIGALLSIVLPTLEPAADNTQITGRVSPTLVDLAAAASTGLAGAFAVGRRDIGDILPGVAIAISLVPPLAVVGVTAVDGDWDGAAGALLLFLTNALAIVVVGALLFSALRLRHGQAQDPAFRSRPVYAVVAVASVLVVAGLSVVTVRTVQLTNWRDAATRVGSAWARDHDERLVQARFEGDTLVLLVEGESDGGQDAQLPELLRGSVPKGTPIVVNRIRGRHSSAGEVAG